MKTPTWTVNSEGQVIKCDPFEFSALTCSRSTKAEATAHFLARAKKMTEETPFLRIRNGAFLMVHHDGLFYVCESGPFDRANCPLCIGSASTKEQAEHGASFDYYASDDYQAQHKAAS
jgi:hypothetical protein